MKKSNNKKFYFVSALQVIIAVIILYAITHTNGLDTTARIAINPVPQDATAIIMVIPTADPDPKASTTETPEVAEITPTIEETFSSEITFSTNIPNNPKVKDIIKTVERAYEIENEAAFTLDISKLTTVYINDLRFRVEPSTLKTVREMTDNLSLESAGWLDYKLAYWTWRRDAILNSEAVHKKAKEENRELTTDERASLRDKYGRWAPVRSEGKIKETNLSFTSVCVIGGLAKVVVDDGIWKQEMTLVLVNHQWYIAFSRGIEFHP
jgi:hypothetical protein